MSRIWGRRSCLATDPAKALERVTPADVVGLKAGMQRYGLLLNDQGTIKDDFMFTKLEGEADMYLVVNAGTKDGDFAYIADKLKGRRDGHARGSTARCSRCRARWPATVLERHSPGIDKLTFMKVVRATVAGCPAIVSRSGYTGEDGFEISHRRQGWRACRARVAGGERSSAHRSRRA